MKYKSYMSSCNLLLLLPLLSLLSLLSIFRHEVQELHEFLFCTFGAVDSVLSSKLNLFLIAKIYD